MANKEGFVMCNIGSRGNTGDMVGGRVRIFTNKQPIEYSCNSLSSAVANSKRRIVDTKVSARAN